MVNELWIVLTGLLVATISGMVGTILVLRKMSMTADAISHTVVLGMVLGYLVLQEMNGFWMFIGAMIVGVMTTILIQTLEKYAVQKDAAIGIVFTGLFALGILLISIFAENVHLDLEHVLMGEIVYIPFEIYRFGSIELPKAIVHLSIAVIIIFVSIMLFFKEWKLITFDSILAVTLGIPTALFIYFFMGLVSLSTVVSFDAVGAILVVTFLIVPAASAYLWSKKMETMMFLSVCIGWASVLIGYGISYVVNTSISAAMAASTGLFFVISFLFAPGPKKIYFQLRKKI